MTRSNPAPPRQDLSQLQTPPLPHYISQSDGLFLPIYTSCINFIFSKIQLFFLPSSTAVAHLYFSYTQTVHVAMLGFVLECGEYPKRKYPCACQVHQP